MSVGAAEAASFDAQGLHERAHAAVAEYPALEGWWGEPLETALVAVADAQHPAGRRSRADAAFESLTGWLLSDAEGSEYADPPAPVFVFGAPRPIGADAAAAALTARAALDLRGGSGRITRRAVELVSSACRAQEGALAALHVALAAWALHPVVPDRRDAPWDNIRQSLTRLPDVGLSSVLVAFAGWLADQRRPMFELRLTELPSLTRPEECVLLWLLNSAVQISIERGAGDQAELKALAQRRTDLLAQLSDEVTEATLLPAAVEEYDPFKDGEPLVPSGLGLFEAVMLDLALSGTRERAAVLTEDEFDRLTLDQRDRRLRRYAVVAVGVSLLLGAQGSIIGVLAEAETRLWLGTGLAVVVAGCVLALLLVNRTTRPGVTPEAVGALSGPLLVAVFLLVEGFLLGEGIRTKPIEGEAGIIIGLIIVGLLALIVTAVRRRQR